MGWENANVVVSQKYWTGTAVHERNYFGGNKNNHKQVSISICQKGNSFQDDEDEKKTTMLLPTVLYMAWEDCVLQAHLRGSPQDIEHTFSFFYFFCIQKRLMMSWCHGLIMIIMIMMMMNKTIIYLEFFRLKLYCFKWRSRWAFLRKDKEKSDCQENCHLLSLVSYLKKLEDA